MKLDKNIFLWIVIPTYNRAEDLIACLDSLMKAGINQKQVLVVDNHSNDNTIDLLSRNYPEVPVKALSENLGATGASNIGFEFARKQGATHVLRLDSDTVVDPNFISPLIEQFQADPDIGVVAPKIYYFDSPEKIWYAGADSHPFHFGAISSQRHQEDSPENKDKKEVDYAWGAAMLIKAEVLNKTGGFDTDFFIYYEEIDFCLRLKKIGYKIVFVPESVIWHKVGSAANNAWTAYHWNRSKMLLYRKHAKNGLHLIALIVYFLLFMSFDSLLYYLKIREHSGNRGPLPSSIKGFWAGLTEKSPSEGDEHDVA